MLAATMEHLGKASGDWAFVDIGFSRESPTCGLLINDDDPKELQFFELQQSIARLASESSRPLNLVLEAPLSCAFTAAGNPVGRSMEKKDQKTRYWYAGLGCQVTLAAAYVLRPLIAVAPARTIRLFEGFVSFKPKNTKSSHIADVLALQAVAWGTPRANGSVVAADNIVADPSHRVVSAFKVFGFD